MLLLPASSIFLSSQKSESHSMRREPRLRISAHAFSSQLSAQIQSLLSRQPRPQDSRCSARSRNRLRTAWNNATHAAKQCNSMQHLFPLCMCLLHISREEAATLNRPRFPESAPPASFHASQTPAAVAQTRLEPLPTCFSALKSSSLEAFRAPEQKHESTNRLPSECNARQQTKHCQTKQRPSETEEPEDGSEGRRQADTIQRQPSRECLDA